MLESELQGFRLSPQQRRLWGLQQGGPAFPSCVLLRLGGDLDKAALRRALQAVVERHEILRTGFYRPPGARFPLQIIRPPAEPEWRETDLASRSPAEQENDLSRLFEAEASAPFDPESPPLVRARLAGLGPARHALILALPALCADRASLGLLAREILAAHAGVLAGEPEVQHVQFSEWQNGLLAEAEEEGLSFWRGQMAEESWKLELPVERAVPQGGAFAPQRVEVPLAAGLCGALEDLAKTLGTAAPNLLSACWYGLLAWLSGRRDVALGQVFHGRAYEVLENTIGLHSRCLPIRLQLDDRMDFAALVRRTADALASAEEWHEQFLLGARPEWGGEEAVFLPVGFEMERRPSPQRIGGLELAIGRSLSTTERFDLKLHGIEHNGELQAELEFDPQRFDREAVELLARRFALSLSSAVAEPRAELGRVLYLLPDEHRRLVVDFNRTAAEWEGPGCLHQLFEEQARLRPESPALVAGGVSLSYGELDARANRVANRLRALSVGPEERVGICTHRSAAMVVALLGTLKAGAAYVPLDPVLPSERLAGMLAASGVRVLLLEAGLAGAALPAGLEHRILLPSDGDSEGDDAAPAVQVDPAGLAYVLFTSGSTGLPKPVAVEHRQIVNYVRAALERLSPAPGAGYAMVSSFGADLGLTVLFPALSSGGCVHLLSYEEAADADALSDRMASQRIDVLKIVPSHLRALLDSAPGRACLPRRWLVLGGEALPWDLAERLRADGAACGILNHYGPTETTVGVLANPVPGQRPAGAGTVPLGQPLANCRVYLLDRQLRPVAAGMPGEIFIGGAGVSRGYPGHAGATAEKFLPDPFSGEPGARLYRTGDRARHLPGAGLEFLGRIDDQVKIRGFRVEPGEVEALLRQAPGVRAAAVVARRDPQGEQRLIAYVVGARGAGGPGELRSFLSGRLPDYMLPAAFVDLERLPLTPNGKLDRRSLPEPADTARVAGPLVPPEGPVEEVVAAIWSEMLRVDRIDRHDNFFELGGHSLLGVQVVARLREIFQIGLSLGVLFSEPSVAELAAALVAHEARPGQAEKVARAWQRIKSLSGEELDRLLKPKREEGWSSAL